MAKPVSLRRRSIVAGVFSFLMVMIFFLTNWKPFLWVLLTFFPLMFITMPVMIGLPILTLANLIRVPLLWRQHRFKAFVPFLICAFGLYLTGWAMDLGHWLHIREFKANLSQYEAVVDDIVHRRMPPTPTGIVMKGEEDCCYDFHLPPDKKHLAQWGTAEFGEDGTLTVRFILATHFNSHHRKFMYRSDGDFEKAYREREGGTPINEHWAAVSD